jgi:aspartyl protease family protein
LRPLWIILGIIGIACLALVLNHDSGSVLGIENNNFASLVWYGLWGSLVAAAVLPGRGQWKEFARNAVLWLAIILVLTACYTWRYELQDVASRMTAGLIPGSPISSQSADGRAQTTLIRSRDGQFHARVQVNGESVSMLVDTGASVVVLTPADARDAGIDTTNLAYTARVSTANGVTTAAPVTLESVSIGEIGRSRVEAMVARDGALGVSLLGMSFLNRLQATEFRGDRLILTD